MIGTASGSPYGMPPITLGPEYNDSRSRDYSNILKTGPRQEITGPPYQDRTQTTPMGELHAQAHHAAEFNRSLNTQREARGDYMQTFWRRPHEQPATTLPSSTADATAATSRPGPISQSGASGMPQQNMLPSQSPQMMMTAAPYSQPISAHNPMQGSMRAGTSQTPTLHQYQTKSTNMYAGSTGGMAQAPGGYNYPSTGGQMWPQTPQTPQYSYSHPSQAQPSPHQPSPSATQMRHPGQNNQVPTGLPYAGMPGMSQAYPSQSPSLPYDQTPRGYMQQPQSAGPAVTQSWSGQQQQPTQWWSGQQQ